MTPKSLAEADGFRSLPRKVTVGVEGDPLISCLVPIKRSLVLSGLMSKLLSESYHITTLLRCAGRLRVSKHPNLYRTGETTGTLSSRRRMTPDSMFGMQTVDRSNRCKTTVARV